MNPLKAKLAAKAPTIGSWLTFADEATTEIMARAGFEWLVVDMEHSGTTTGDMCRLVRIIELAGIAPLVRVGANDPLLIKHALDGGAHGVIVPMVNTKEEALRAARAVHYPPRGERGVGSWRAQGYGTRFEEYFQKSAEDLVLVVQIEHWRAVEELPAILDVPAVDGFMIGPYDLSGSLGVPGEFKHPRFLECLAKVEEVCRTHRKTGGYHIVHPDPELTMLKEKLALGYSFIAYGTDMIFFTRQVYGEAARLRAGGHLR